MATVQSPGKSVLICRPWCTLLATIPSPGRFLIRRPWCTLVALIQALVHFSGYNTESRAIHDTQTLVHLCGYNTESRAIHDTQTLVHFSGYNTESRAILDTQARVHFGQAHWTGHYFVTKDSRILTSCQLHRLISGVWGKRRSQQFQCGTSIFFSSSLSSTASVSTQYSKELRWTR